MDKIRLDSLLLERGLAASRPQAQRLVLAGKVRVEGLAAAKPGHRVARSAGLEVRAPERYVGRGGYKLEAALAHFELQVEGRVCLDVGASTGGFTDCLLQHGAARVMAVDVGRGQLHWSLRQDARVAVLERCHARYLEPSDLPAEPEFAAVDVSFISLRLILPAVAGVVRPGSRVVTLIKPQFEAGREQVARGGVVRDEEVRERVVAEIRRFGEREVGLRWMGVRPSPLRGPAGNVEYLACWEKP